MFGPPPSQRPRHNGPRDPDLSDGSVHCDPANGTCTMAPEEIAIALSQDAATPRQDSPEEDASDKANTPAFPGSQ